MEQRTDMYVSTLRKYIEAFPEGSVRIKQCSEV
jgi:hypothetical protein